jgi:tRNA(Ile)-lysidine synthetase-like protein
MDELRDRVERFVREHELIPAGGEVTCLVSGGADSTCLWHLLGSLGYRVSALHVNHKLRGADSEEDARFCADVLGAEVVELDGRGLSEASLREQRRSLALDRLRATGHTASDQVETILYRLVSRGAPTGIAPRSGDGIVHPLLPLWREETEAYCRAAGLEFRVDTSNADTKRGLIRDEILLRALDNRATLPPALAELLAAPVGSKRVDLGGGLQAVREHERLWLERGPVELAGEIRWGDWTIRSQLEGLRVRGWRPGDRLAGRRRKIQDVFVDAKVPRSEREAWPLVVRGDEVVAVPGIVEHPEVEAVRD